MATGVYGSPMEWFNIGKATAPMAGMGNAIRGILDMHTKYGELAAGKAFESAMPESQAKTRLYGAQADYFDSTSGGSGYVDPNTGLPVPAGTAGAQWVNRGKGGTINPVDLDPKRKDAITIADRAWWKSHEDLPATPEDIDEYNKSIQFYYNQLIGQTPTANVPETKSSGFGNMFKSAGNLMTNAVSGFRNITNAPFNTGTKAGNVMGKFQQPVASPQVSNQGKTFNTTQEADASGLPVGTVVIVAGRRYQI